MMLSLLQAAILGIVQGITEWLPISSSGHLAIIQNIWGVGVPVAFDVLLHFGTLIVILAVFWKDIINMLKALVKLDFKSEYGKLLLFVIIGSLPTAIIALLFQDIFESFFFNLSAVAIALLITGTLLALSERWANKRDINVKDSLLIGIAQGLAFIPGLSRSGATISAGLLRGADKVKVARFSFLLAIPAIIGATALKISEFALETTLIAPAIVGTAVAILFGYVSLKALLKIIVQKKFHYFSAYCFAIGILLLLYNAIPK